MAPSCFKVSLLKIHVAAVTHLSGTRQLGKEPNEDGLCDFLTNYSLWGP